MRPSRLYFIAKLFVYSSLLCIGLAGAQTPDRVQTFDSQITVDKDRTLHVEERFEIVNGSGIFDSGFHRQLRIKPISPQRVKVGSFQRRPRFIQRIVVCWLRFYPAKDVIPQWIVDTYRKFPGFIRLPFFDGVPRKQERSAC